MNQTHKKFRILSVSLSSRGFGYAVTEGDNALVDYGHKVFSSDKSIRTLAHVVKLIVRNVPEMLVLSDANAKGVRRAPRIRELHRNTVALARRHKLTVVKVSAKELRVALLGTEKGTKHEMAESLAARFPEELASRLPPKRRAWESEDARMDIFAAVGLAVAGKGR